MTRRRSINDRRSCGFWTQRRARDQRGGGLESRWKDDGGGRGRGEGEHRRRDRSVELVPFHGSLETIILIKLTTGPPRGYKGILRNDLPRSASRGPLNRWIPRNATRTDDKFYGSTGRIDWERARRGWPRAIFRRVRFSKRIQDETAPGWPE